jgi:hypothetical protein
MNRQRTTRRTALLLAGTALAAAAGVVPADAATATPASTGGGCTVSSPSFTVSACISAAGGGVEGQVVVSSLPGCLVLEVGVSDLTTGRVLNSRALHECGPANVLLGPFAGTNGDVYQTFADYTNSGGALVQVLSPRLFFTN